MEPETKASATPSTFGEITESLGKPLQLLVEINGELKTIELRRLTANERQRVDDLYNEVETRSNRVLPPPKRGSDGESRPDESDPRYRQALAGMRRQARALAMSLAWAQAREAAAAAGVPADEPQPLCDWLERALPESMIEAVYLRTLSDGISIALGERVNFISAGG